jgi:TolB protein
MKIHLRILVLISLILTTSIAAFSQSKIFIDVGEAKVHKSLLAFPTLQFLGSKQGASVDHDGDELYSVINNDLASTGLFVDVDHKAYLEDPAKTGLRPSGVAPNGFDFNSWKTIGTEFLIKGGYQIIGDQITLEIYAYYVPQGNLVLGKKYQTSKSTYRRLAHTFANDFVKAVTGKPGFFNNQIVVAIDKGVQTNREIYISDWDGANAKQITNHKTISISPAWSPNGEFIAYTSFVKRKVGTGPAMRNPDLFIYEVKTGKRWLVSYRSGMNSGAEFTPDNQHILVTLSQGKTADLYNMTLDGRAITPLTQGPALAMNVEAAITSDGSTIAFSSDRSDRPMIYTMDKNGRNVQRRTFMGLYNSTPTWSPDGKKIAFAGLDKAHDAFDIFIMNSDGSGSARLTSAHRPNGHWASNEDPAFSPDGRHVLFVSDRTGTKQLYLINTDGTNERRLTYDHLYYSKPKWGPEAE